MGKSVAIHTNLKLEHQREYAGYLQEGFKAHGYEVLVTGERQCNADLHVVQGPHYALQDNVGKNTIFLDRCYWGHPRRYVSLAWLDESGGKVWETDAPGDRYKPRTLPWNEQEARALVLNDYAKRFPDAIARGFFESVEVREHPAKEVPADGLNEAMRRNDVAIGYSSSALVSAAIRGLPVVCFDPHSPVYSVASHELGTIIRPDRGQWLNNLSYMNWSAAEIESGQALERLLCQSH